MSVREDANLTPSQQGMSDLWDRHTQSEFETSSVEATMDTMVEDPYVNHVPVMTGGVGRDEVRKFYSERFIPQQPPDTEIAFVTRTIGEDRLVDELILVHPYGRDGLDAAGRHSNREAG
jgi:carboxymethylenebutenolidase